MKRLTQEEINKVLENHKHWLAEDCDFIGWKKASDRIIKLHIP